ncbi:MAG: ribosome-binding factor A [Verrucomicrobiales bacterium]|nr:ribosome-binding factor A [Verrucomicrobiales bacterium]|tara:strand:+ start:4190 stop:4546 length:357 start_codon:yes stop_codon:yes gene_type:complete
MAGIRIERVRELLKRTLGEIIRRHYPPGDLGLITVNDVDVSKDLTLGTVYIGVVGNEDQKKRALNRLGEDRKQIQFEMAREVVLKNTPVLRFRLDESVERGNRVLDIIEELEHESDEE